MSEAEASSADEEDSDSDSGASDAPKRKKAGSKTAVKCKAPKWKRFGDKHVVPGAVPYMDPCGMDTVDRGM